MTRAAITDETTPARRRELHAHAAELSEDEGPALLHLVSATPTADENLAAALDRLGDRRASEGAWSDSAEVLIDGEPDHRGPRVADEPPDPRRGRADGRVGRAAGALVRPGTPGGADLPMRDTVLGYIAIQRGRAGEAQRLLTHAWETVDAEQDPRLAG